MSRQAGDRGRVDHVPLLALFEHGREERLDAVDDAPEVHAERPVPVLDGVLPELRPLATTADAGVVEQQVHLAVGVQRLLGQLLDRLRARHIGQHTDNVVLRLLHLLHCGVQRLLLDIGEYDLHALASEALRERPAHPARPTGDHGHFALEVTHRSPPPSIDPTNRRDCTHGAARSRRNAADSYD